RCSKAATNGAQTEALAGPKTPIVGKSAVNAIWNAGSTSLGAIAAALNKQGIRTRTRQTLACVVGRKCASTREVGRRRQQKHVAAFSTGRNSAFEGRRGSEAAPSSPWPGIEAQRAAIDDDVNPTRTGAVGCQNEIRLPPHATPGT